MAEGAKVNSIDAIKMFRIYLAKFGEYAGVALGDAESEVNRTMMWLETEQQAFWIARIRKCQELLARAEDALRQKTLFKDASGSRQSAVDEQKAVMIAKKNLAEAQEKMANTKSWIRKLQKEITMYRGGMGRFAGAISGGVPAAIAQLGNTLSLLDQYVSAAPTEVASTTGEMAASAVGADGGSAPSMARGAEALVEAAKPDPQAVAYRGKIPALEVLDFAPAAEEGELALPIATPNADDRQHIVASAMPIPLNGDDRVVFAKDVPAGATWVVARISGTCVYLGPVDGPPPAAYNAISVKRLLELRPDLAEAIAVTMGGMVAIGPNGLQAVFGQGDLRSWPLV